MKEFDIRPPAVFDTFLELAEKDIKRFFQTQHEEVECPACDGKGIHAFSKHAFSYKECESCQTLFVSPRPLVEAFHRYYQESESANYWASTFYKETAEARREKLWKPKAQLVYEIIQKHASSQHQVFDIGGGYGIFAEEFQKVSGQGVTVIEPGPALAEVCRQKGLKVIQGFLENLDVAEIKNGPKVFVSFELFEHLHTPRIFLDHVYKLMSAGDLFVFTTLSGTGVDIQALWEDSKSVAPPHHLNFLNPKSIKYLLGKVGFTTVEVSTPGKLDIDILCNNQEKIKDRFWKTFVMQSNDERKATMQNFIAENQLSSHMLVICGKT